MQRSLIVYFFLVFLSRISAQDIPLRYYENKIIPEKIYKHLEVLASDSLEGRETGEAGMIKASEYVSGELKKSGLSPGNVDSYFQNISFLIEGGSGITVRSNTGNFIAGEDYYSSDFSSINKEIIAEIIFAGYGIIDSVSGWNDYKNTDVKNKVVIILDGEPKNKKGDNILKANDSNDIPVSNRELKFKNAREKGVAAILFVNNKIDFNSFGMTQWKEKGKYILGSNHKKTEQPLLHISTEMANRLLMQNNISIDDYVQRVYKKKYYTRNTGISSEKITISFKPETKSCRNVAGFIEGKSKKGEFVVLSAHLDHLGMKGDKIYYGADDDGSGCSSLLTIADVFAQAANEGNRPERSILFLFFTGEEKGLLGSEYYVNNPLVSLDSTIADLNVDMIGRVDTFSRESKYYIYIIGSDRMSTDLHNLNEDANEKCCKLELDYRYNDPAHPLKLYQRSDHYNFVKHNVPVIFYFTGLHKDYHKPTDTIEKVDIEKTAAIARLIFNTAWELANQEKRPAIDQQ